MKKIILTSFFALIFFSIFAEKYEPIPVLNSRVTDVTETLSEEQILLLENKLQVFEDSLKNQVVVLIVSTTGSESIEEYSIRVAEEWKIGRKEHDDGVILLVVRNDRELRIEVGYGLEAILTDVVSSYIINDYIVPEFKNGNFYGGINKGVEQITGILSGQIDTELYSFNKLPINVPIENKDTEVTYSSLSSQFPLLGMLLMMISFFLPMLPLFFTRKSLITIIIVSLIPILFTLFVGYFWGSFLIIIGIVFVPVLIAIFVITFKIQGKSYDFFSGGSNSSGGYNSSNYSSSNYGSNSSYGSSNSGGYSGGGGSFGGGGASGSW